MKDISKHERFSLTNSQLAINCEYERRMKINYSDETVRLKIVEISKKRPDLYERYLYLRHRIRMMDYDKFKRYINNELKKSERNRNKEVKRIGGENSYEFRIPPYSDNGVMRVEFEDEGDHYTLRITDAFIKERTNRNEIT